MSGFPRRMRSLQHELTNTGSERPLKRGVSLSGLLVLGFTFLQKQAAGGEKEIAGV